jgi:hypothetical protein
MSKEDDKPLAIIHVNEHYRVAKVPNNYQLQKWVEESVVMKGRKENQGKVLPARWKLLESYHGTIPAALRAIGRKMLEDELEETQEMDALAIAVHMEAWGLLAY